MHGQLSFCLPLCYWLSIERAATAFRGVMPSAETSTLVGAVRFDRRAIPRVFDSRQGARRLDWFIEKLFGELIYISITEITCYLSF